MSDDLDIAKLRKQRNELEEKRKKLAEELPHLYAFKWYKWAWDFFNHTNEMGLLCAANQISKSSTAIRKNIHRATDVGLWRKLWPKRPRPKQFWYLYPDRNVATAEFQNKWVEEFMPKTGAFNAEPFREENVGCKYDKYGWKAYYEKKKIDYIQFQNGVRIYFKTYAQDVHSLQSGTVHMITCDEELPEDLLPELQARLFNTDGYFDMVFTATRNQELWWRAIEGKKDSELFPQAFKLQVTMYDCREYMDHTEGHFNNESIAKHKAKCKSEIEVQRRIYGRFVTEIGRIYGAFDPGRHYVTPFKINNNFRIYGGVDIGSGGMSGHPSAVCFLAVTPDCRKGFFFKGERMDGVVTTAGDALQKFIEIRADSRMTQQAYDPACADFNTIAVRAGEPFTKPDKSHDIGEGLINTLFKNNMLFIFDEPEMQKLGGEFLRIMQDTPKKHRKDDFADAARYATVLVPWDWTAIKGEPTEKSMAAKAVKQLSEKEAEEWEVNQRRGIDPRKSLPNEWKEFDDELAYWNQQYG
jgi:hypothetical protein